MKLAGKEIGPWKCKFCGKIFSTVRGLSIHLGIKQREIKEQRPLPYMRKYNEIQKEKKKRLRKYY